ncbi:MAG TPA: BON domain-containing protein [Pseudobdellovibrionaceae bacterium]|jgi:osmotically-inducible protein OsmY
MFTRKIVTAAVMAMAVNGTVFAVSHSDADNTKLNQRDAKNTKQSALTPDIQTKGSPQDVELTRLLRQELTNDKTLSTNAQNIKIITLDGIVTLRGPVESQEEKQRIDALAKKTAGVKRVDNQLDVKSKAY